jgi:diguanylate cyclase (GGDEF)-like protein
MNAKILVIDADKLVVQLLEKALGKAGHEVTPVDNAPKALRLLDTQSFDLVITDVAMPKLTGIQVLEQVKALDDAIEVIVFAGAEEESFENALAALRLGASDFLTKPLRNIDELMAAVERALARRDVSTNIRNLTESLERLRRTDMLTGIPTRRYFLERVSIELRRARRHKKNVSCLLVDIDYLEQINRDYGRPCGDQVLVYVARAVTHDRRITDILGRYGGEEFVIVMPETRADQALIAAEKIRQRVEEGKFSFGGQTIPVTVSIGVSGAMAPEGTAELIDQANLALREGKRSGRNCVRSVEVKVSG